MLKALRLVLIIMALVVVANTVSASTANGWRHWKSGTITKEPWVDGRVTWIEIDNISYSFMPKADFIRTVKKSNGSFVEQPISRAQVYESQDVEILVQGFRIYQIKVLP